MFVVEDARFDKLARFESACSTFQLIVMREKCDTQQPQQPQQIHPYRDKDQGHEPTGTTVVNQRFGEILEVRLSEINYEVGHQ